MAPISKTIRLNGSSTESFEDAIRTTVARAAETIAGIESFEVLRQTGRVDEAGVVALFEVTIDLTFGVRDTVHG